MVNPMYLKIIVILLVLTALSVTGYISTANDKELEKKLAHESAVRSIGPDTLPTHNKKW